MVEKLSSFEFVVLFVFASLNKGGGYLAEQQEPDAVIFVSY
jgi:hypothetical protein